ncbi:hypothetical protein SRHO_G00333960 [Serrasalmus rhombeus]
MYRPEARQRCTNSSLLVFTVQSRLFLRLRADWGNKPPAPDLREAAGLEDDVEQSEQSLLQLRTAALQHLGPDAVGSAGFPGFKDGTFQKRSVLTVSPEELNRHNYTCIIQHSSLEEEMVLQVSDNGVLSGRRNLRPHLKGKLESESVLCRHQSSFHMTSK